MEHRATSWSGFYCEPHRKEASKSPIFTQSVSVQSLAVVSRVRMPKSRRGPVTEVKNRPSTGRGTRRPQSPHSAEIKSRSRPHSSSRLSPLMSERRLTGRPALPQSITQPSQRLRASGRTDGGAQRRRRQTSAWRRMEAWPLAGGAAILRVPKCIFAKNITSANGRKD